jgi:succinate dehydrogenase / fumarate reductase, cytochrome b subunit
MAEASRREAGLAASRREAGLAASRREAGLARRLHSIAGIVPVGAFLVVHLVTNAAALRGADAYNAMAARMQGLPLVVAVEVLVIALPLFFHGIYGLFLTAEEPAPASPPRRKLLTAQRATGIVLFAFVLFHLWTARLVQIHDHESLDLFRLMQAALARPVIYAAYVAGILSATFHLSAGLYTFSDAWGLAVSARARRAAAFTSGAIFLGLSVVGLTTLSAFRL